MKYSVESSADLVVIAENCKATKDGSYYSSPSYYLIQNGRYMFVAQEVKRLTYFIYLYIYLFICLFVVEHNNYDDDNDVDNGGDNNDDDDDTVMIMPRLIGECSTPAGVEIPSTLVST